MQRGLGLLVLISVSVLVVVLFHGEVAVCCFTVGAVANAYSVLKCGAAQVAVAYAIVCAFSCLQLLLIACLQAFLNLGL